uniref:Uncharacterized protein n=1 Tax=virus sp. ctJLD79 TaxID=2827987 RepID=A0A8S5RFF3_9VIRU|nr:MAG TPA: hypothetical protein [virus sp. ctJLD79]
MVPCCKNTNKALGTIFLLVYYCRIMGYNT